MLQGQPEPPRAWMAKLREREIPGGVEVNPRLSSDTLLPCSPLTFPPSVYHLRVVVPRRSSQEAPTLLWARSEGRDNGLHE